ncbi:Rv0361 family membrane protein [Nocardia blacklockiae]|uniref:Rv0361 family membrane protein n=1 Tax=Nocardia blacklockiae TaxID=480036 RepID=UPI0018931568|nr:hypothetical protein [Nocardia blacklockiae]MBF6172408.1 hypothetical protein [Nocardia blacklockiae]
MTYPPGGPPSFPEPPSYYPPEGYPPVTGADAPPLPPPPGPPPRGRRTGLIAVFLVVALFAVAGAIGVVALLTGQGKGPLASDERKIEAAIRDFYDTIATAGVDAAMAKSCRVDRDEYAALPPDQRATIASETLTIRIDTIDDIVVRGDRATAKLHGALAPTSGGLIPDLDAIDNAPEYLRKENGAWKVCAADNR